MPSVPCCCICRVSEKCGLFLKFIAQDLSEIVGKLQYRWILMSNILDIRIVLAVMSAVMSVPVILAVVRHCTIRVVTLQGKNNIMEFFS